LNWNGDPVTEVQYKGVKDRNILYSASWYSGITIVKGTPTIAGVGFSTKAVYGCLYFIPGAQNLNNRMPGTATSSSTIECATNLPANGPIMKTYNANKNAQVIVQPQVSTDNGKTYVNMVNSKPSSVPFETVSTTGKPLMYKYVETACGDGNQAVNEVGIDCGKAACGVVCDWSNGGEVKKGAICDVSADCSGGGSMACFDGKCQDAYFSCADIKRLSPKTAKSGLFTINIDKNYNTFEKQPESIGTVEVYCRDYDGMFQTLIELVSSNTHSAGKSPYRMVDKVTRHPAKDSRIGNYWATGNKNVAARYEVEVFNSVFKHSQGYVMSMYANNRQDYHFTDVFGDPDNGKHLLHKENTCSDRSSLNMAKGYRPTANAVRGYCFKNQQIGGASNCICGDTSSRGVTFNKCGGQNGNWRRYNGLRSRNRFCNGQAHKCNNGDNYHGFLGDTYGCDINRNIHGHMWQGYGGNRGMPCTGYGSYGCYGSRWIS
jgi:hypothetical protein